MGDTERLPQQVSDSGRSVTHAHVWEILPEKGFRRLRGGPRLYAQRSKAEEAVARCVQAYHAEVIANMLLAINDDPELWDDPEAAWWREGPPVTVHRTQDMTFYCLGDPNADSRDRCAAALGWIMRRVVL